MLNSFLLGPMAILMTFEEYGLSERLVEAQITFRSEETHLLGSMT